MNRGHAMSQPRLRIHVLLLCMALPLAASAQGIRINGITLDAGSGRMLGTLSGQGGMNEFIRLRREMVFAVLQHVGISPDTLPANVRRELEQPQTTSLEALVAFSRGLDLADRGQFADAARAFREAVQLDPGFSLAASMASMMPAVNLQGGGGTEIQTLRQEAAQEGQEEAAQQLQQVGGGVPEVVVGDTTPTTGGGDTTTETTPSASTVVTEDTQRDAIAAAIDTSLGTLNGYAAAIRSTAQPVNTFMSFSAGSSELEVLTSTDPSKLVMNQSPTTAARMHGSIEVGADGNIERLDFQTDQALPVEGAVGEGSQYTDLHDFQMQRTSANEESRIETLSGWDGDYTTWGSWEKTLSEDGVVQSTLNGVWVAGGLTPAANIPNTGSVHYAGSVLGYATDALNNDNNPARLSGSMTMDVNFGTRALTGSFSALTYNAGSSTWINGATMSGSLLAGNGFVAGLSGEQISDGSARGSFFGPAAQEVGAAWKIDKTGGASATGVFVGKSGATR